jgi:hypothetical protein
MCNAIVYSSNVLMVLVIRLWFKVDSCFTIMSYDDIVYYLILS